MAGFKINGVVYAIPGRFRMGDTVLVKELTGLEFTDFAQRLDDMQEALDAGDPTMDLLAVTGLVGVAVWQANERWPRERVRRFVEALDVQALQAEGGDELDPPAQAGEADSHSPASSNVSITTPAGSPTGVPA